MSSVLSELPLYQGIALFIVKNALRNVVRNKGRNILMIIIVTIIAAAATISLAIVQAAQRARTDALQDTTITAQISLDRRALMDAQRPDTTQSTEKPDMSSLSQSMADKQLTLNQYEEYAQITDVESSYYTLTSSVAAVDDGVEPVDSSGTITSSSDSSTDSSADSDTQSDTQTDNNADAPQMPQGEMQGGGMGGGGRDMQMTTGDFSLVGFSDDEALQNAPNGSFTMESGQAFTYGSDDLNDVIISSTLATANDLSVGDTITVANAADEDTTYTFTIVGIYTDTANTQQAFGGPMQSTASDPANAIYTSVATMQALKLTADESMQVTDARGNTRDTQAATLSYTYVFAGKDQYDQFVDTVRADGLGDEYTISSPDVEAYEASLVPLNNLAKFATTMLIVVLAVGAVVLMVLTIFNIRERKYEIGVLTAIGVKKAKVATQFIIELFTVTLIGIALGLGIGAASSVPVSNALLSSQVEAQQTQQASQRAQFGRDMQMKGASSGDEQNNTQNAPADMPSDMPNNEGPQGFADQTKSAISTVNATVNWATIGWMVLIGLALTLLAALIAVIFVMRYEPLQILADRS